MKFTLSSGKVKTDANLIQKEQNKFHTKYNQYTYSLMITTCNRHEVQNLIYHLYHYNNNTKNINYVLPE